MTPLGRSIYEVIASGVLGGAAGALAGFLGLGGGSVLPPMLAFALGIDQHRAQGLSLAALLPPVGLPALIAYRRLGVRVEVRLVVYLVVGFALGAFVGAKIAHLFSSRALSALFAAFLVVSAWRALRSSSNESAADGAERTSTAPFVGTGIGAVAGVMSGLLGIGGGIVALPLLQRFGRLTRLEAQAATIAMMLPPIGLPAVYVYASEGSGLSWPLLFAVAAGFTLGTGIGARFAGRVDSKTAARVYAALLVTMAALLLARVANG